MKKLLVISIFLLSATVAHAQSVDLLWEGGTYTPPFYKGLPLWTYQAPVTLVAIPQGVGNTSGLSYRWSMNGSVLGGVSGVGKTSLSFAASIISKPQTIKIDIFSSDNPDDNTLLASNSITLAPSAPQILVYEDNPLYGFMFHQEIGADFTLKESEATLAAFPLYFGAVTRADSTLKYQWLTNSGEVETKNEVTYRAPDGQQGSSDVTLHINSTSKLLENVSRNFQVEFGQTNNL